jgi:hypothetical protein
MDPEERDRRLRRVFGPPTGVAAAQTRPRRPPAWLLPALGAALLLAAVALTVYVLTPHDHVAGGCSWWTARGVGQVVPGQSGCVKGYAVAGGGLAEGTAAGDIRLALVYSEPDQPVLRQPCDFAPGTAVVVRYRSLFDDGRTLILVVDCR